MTRRGGSWLPLAAKEIWTPKGEDGGRSPTFSPLAFSLGVTDMSYPVAYRAGARERLGFRQPLPVSPRTPRPAPDRRRRTLPRPVRLAPKALPLPRAYSAPASVGPAYAGPATIGIAAGLAIAAAVQAYRNVRDSVGAEPTSWDEALETPANYVYDGPVNNNAPHSSYQNPSEARWYNMSLSNWNYYQTNGTATNWDQTFSGHVNHPAYHATPTSTYGIAQSTRRTRGLPTWPNATSYSWHEIYKYSAGAPAVPATDPGFTEFPDGPPEIIPLPHVQPVMPEVLPAPAPWPQVQPLRRYRDIWDPAGSEDLGNLPRSQPRPRPARAADRAVGVEIVAVISPRGLPRLAVASSTSHPTRPPRKNERERKQKARTRIGIGFELVQQLTGRNVRRGLDNLTEALDWLNAIYFALPEEVREADPAFTPQEQLMAIIENYDQIELDTLVKNIVVMELTDRFLGQLSSRAQTNLGNAGFTGDFFGPVL